MPESREANEHRQHEPAGSDLRGDVRVLMFQVGELDKKVDRFFDEVKNNYASKNELLALKEDVKSLNNNMSWVIKLIVGAVVIALLGIVVIKGGVPHP